MPARRSQPSGRGWKRIFATDEGQRDLADYYIRMRYEIRQRTRKEGRMATDCAHLDEIRDVTPSGDGCKECLEMGDTWVHLRECLICGHIGCCDNSKNRHATKHFHATGHPIIQSFEPGEDWRWCYVDEE
jgi:hypothetical protein